MYILLPFSLTGVRVRPSDGGRRGTVWGKGRGDIIIIVVYDDAEFNDIARLSLNIISGLVFRNKTKTKLVLD